MSFDAEKQLHSSTPPPNNTSKVLGCLSFVPIVLGRNTSRFSRLLRHNVIGKILLILGSGYIITIAMLYLFSNDVYPSTDSIKSIFDSSSNNRVNIDDSSFNPRAAVAALKATSTEEVSIFRWSDWLDLSDVEGFGEEHDQSRFNWFAKPKKNISDFNFPPRTRQDGSEHAFAAKLYLDKIARVPSQVILVGDARATYIVKAEDDSRNHVDYSEQPERIETKAEREKRLKEEAEKKKKEEEEKKKKEEAEKKKKEEREKKKKEAEERKKKIAEEKKKEEEEKKKNEEGEKKNEEGEKKNDNEGEKKKEEEEKKNNEEGEKKNDNEGEKKNDEEEKKNDSEENKTTPTIKDEEKKSKRDNFNLSSIPIVSQVPEPEETQQFTKPPKKIYHYLDPLAGTDGKSPLEIFPPVVPALAYGTLEDKVAVELDPSLFTLDLARIQTVHENSSYLEIKHAEMVQKARKYVTDSEKHFYEVSLNNDPYGHGTHYDWRFFDLVRLGVEHEAIMHHLMRAWSMFANQEGIATWISHGSLIGWYWNGIAMPWDSDNDVQMPVVELDRFAQLYNGTLVVEDEREGTGRYYIDVGPFYVSRLKGNGKNVIDARFIDIRSGIYIDITGLAATDRPGQFACKNNHYYHQDWLSPMRRTLYEGVEVYMPNMFEAVLQDEYHGYRQSAFKDWSFNRDLRLWIPSKKCAKFNVPSQKYDEDDEINLYGACNDVNIFKEYTLTKDVSREHANEMDIYNQMDTVQKNGKNVFVDSPESRALFANEFRQYYPPLRPDPAKPKKKH